ncbi:MAG: hypothetical protein GY928_08175 [Colwellia sp.]|nr:hypothetical protein [Colwellia sp.]
MKKEEICILISIALTSFKATTTILNNENPSIFVLLSILSIIVFFKLKKRQS